MYENNFMENEWLNNHDLILENECELNTLFIEREINEWELY